MKLVRPEYEILTDISKGGVKELQLIEKIGRVCYKSEDRITEDGESAKKFIKNLIKREHFAMIEHSSLSVMFTVDRGVTHEMVRHRLASFAQESTRYCNYSVDKFGNSVTFVVPSLFLTNDEYTEYLNKNTIELELYPNIKEASTVYYWKLACLDSEDSYITLLNNGLKAQFARSVLNNSVKANITITANYREWRQIFHLRCEQDAHPDMRFVMVPLLNEIHNRIPVVFDDLYERFSVQEDFDKIVKAYTNASKIVH